MEARRAPPHRCQLRSMCSVLYKILWLTHVRGLTYQAGHDYIIIHSRQELQLHSTALDDEGSEAVTWHIVNVFDRVSSYIYLMAASTGSRHTLYV